MPEDKSAEKTDESTEETEETTEESTEETEGGDESSEETEESTDEETEESEEDGEDDLPDWARSKLTKANTEAANYRTKLREAEEKLKDAKTPEEVEKIVNQMTEDREKAEVALLRENVALKFKLPAALQKRLSGTTREEMEADAKELADLFGTDEDDEMTLEGGLSPRDRETDPDDPRALAAKYGRRGKRR